MNHNKGARLSAVHDADTLRMRCVCDAATGCWHFRKADGKPYRRGERMRLWIFGGTFSTPLRAMWAFTSGKPVPASRTVYRRCDSFDCINPDHLRCSTKTQAVRYSVARNGVSEASVAGLRAAAARRTKITPELRTWALESTQSRLNAIRKQAHQRLPTAASSVFAMGDAMNAHHLRSAA